MTKIKGTRKPALKKQKKLMRKHTKDVKRHKAHSTGGVSENAIQHQMLSEFGSVENFVKNVHHLADMMRTEEDLKKLRFDAQKIYAKLDLADPDTHDAMADLYASDDITAYSEAWEHFWKEKRGEILPDIVTDEMAEGIARTFKVLQQKKRGFKKDYRAVLAGNLLIQSHIVALTEAPIGENNLWELMFNATLKENKVELPAPRARTAPEAEPAAVPATETKPAEPAAEPTPEVKAPEPVAEPAPEAKAEEPAVKPAPKAPRARKKSIKPAED